MKALIVVPLSYALQICFRARMTFAPPELSTLATLFLEIAVILVASQLAARALRGTKQPVVIAEILVGITLGPSLLGWCSPSLASALFPPSTMPVFKGLSQIGLVLFMFLVGLELDRTQLQGRARAVIAISVASLVVPFVIGLGLGTVLAPDYSAGTVPKGVFVLFCGVALSVTAFPVLARILSELRIATTQVGSLAIACAAIGDVVAWCLLALVVALARSGSALPALWTLAAMALFVATMILGVRPLLQRALRTVTQQEDVTPGILAVILGLLFLSSAATETLGLHALSGAFIFGACVPRSEAVTHAIADKFHTVTIVLLLPLFFAYSGLHTRLGLINTWPQALLTLGIVSAASVGKVVGPALAARATGLSWRDAGTIGVLMNTRGLVELIVLNVGLELEIISEQLFTMFVVMALVTTVATTPIVRRIASPRAQH